MRLQEFGNGDFIGIQRSDLGPVEMKSAIKYVGVVQQSR